MRSFKTILIVFFLLMAMVISTSAIAFDSGSTGADGALELALNEHRTLQMPADGVFNFTTVTINAGAVLTFAKNADNTPVTLLATGDVLISGEINVNGKDGNYIIPGVGGPGGFDGGVGGVVKSAGQKGAGPGGGYGGQGLVTASSDYYATLGGGGSYSTAGDNGADQKTYTGGALSGAAGAVYGNDRLLPLVGGAGGGGGGGSMLYTGGSGGGGGGAILIASTSKIALMSTGAVKANGGKGARGEHYVNTNGYSGGAGGGGSGGAMRLLAPQIDLQGTLTALGDKQASLSYSNKTAALGGKGYIRLEYNEMLNGVATDPPFIVGALYSVEPANMPAIRIASIDGIVVGASPNGNYGTPDIVLPFNTTNPIDVVIQAENIDPAPGVTVTLSALPATGSATSNSAPLVGDITASTVTIPISISTTTPSVLVASVTVDAAVAFNQPVFVEGEKVAQLRIESTVGANKSNVILITESGREIPYTM